MPYGPDRLNPNVGAYSRQSPRVIVVLIAVSTAASWRHGEAIVPIFVGRGAPTAQTYVSGRSQKT